MKESITLRFDFARTSYVQYNVIAYFFCPYADKIAFAPPVDTLPCAQRVDFSAILCAERG